MVQRDVHFKLAGKFGNLLKCCIFLLSAGSILNQSECCLVCMSFGLVSNCSVMWSIFMMISVFVSGTRVSSLWFQWTIGNGEIVISRMQIFVFYFFYRVTNSTAIKWDHCVLFECNRICFALKYWKISASKPRGWDSSSSKWELAGGWENGTNIKISILLWLAAKKQIEFLFTAKDYKLPKKTH